MSGLSGLSGRSGLSGAGGGGTSLTPGYEYQKLSPKDFYGKVSVTLDAGTLATGGTVELDFTSGTMSAAALQTALETIADTGNVEVAIIDDYFQIKFIGDLAEYNLDHTTLTPSASYVPNDGSGTAPTKLGQSNYVAAAQEEVTLTLTPIDPGQNAASVDSNGNSITYDFNTTLYTTAAGGDFTCTGGANSATATFESASNGPKNTTYNAIASSNNGTASVTINTAGATEANAQVNVTFTGAAGWITYATSSPSFSVAISVTALDAAVLATLNDAARYNGTVDSVAMGSTSMTVNFTATNNPGTVTIGGETGAAVTPAVTTLQNGVLEVPTLPAPVLAISFAPGTVFQTVGGVAAVADGDPIGSALGTPPTTIDGVQSTSGSRPSFIAAGGATFDGAGDYVDLPQFDALNAASALTITSWFQRASTSAKVVVFANTRDTTATNDRTYIVAWTDGNIYFILSNGSGAYGFCAQNDALWHHVAMVFDGAQSTNADRLKAYIDGSPVSLTFSGTIPATTWNNTATTPKIGRLEGMDYSSGSQKDVRVYDVALTADQITYVMAGEF